MGLTEYRRKRDFRKTPEPRGKKAASHHAPVFVVQKHAARQLHYDFRLELDGVLKSWAVPKGPDLDPANKRLAMHVEDHPLEYGDFEGVIPQGEYGGGTVMLWDQGTWEPIGDGDLSFREGRLKFVLHGEKLRGAWMLVRKGGRKDPSERHWFLFKEQDEFADLGRPIIERLPLSVTTGRDLKEIAAQADRVWGPDGEVREKGRKKSAKAGKAAPPKAKKQARTNHDGAAARQRAQGSRAKLDELLENPKAKKASLPKTQEVELATLAKVAPSGSEWVHEIKFDGYRMLCRIADGKAQFISRNGLDWTKKFPELAARAGGLPLESAMLDGEVVALEEDGTTKFQSLQNAFQAGRTRDLIYYVFDILYLNGRSVTELPLEQRKELVEAVVAGSSTASIRYSDHLVGSGPDIMAEACRMQLEGIVSKRLGRPYRPGRGLDWLKVKCLQRDEFVVGGFTRPSGTRRHFGALLLGHYDSDGELIYSGRVGTGFDEKTLAALHKKLQGMTQGQSPFQNLSGTTGQARGVDWVKPQLVAEVAYAHWTNEGLLWHPSFQGLREDKAAREVVRDRPLTAEQVKAVASTGKSTKPRRESKKTSAAKAPKAAAAPAKTASVVAGVRLSHPDKIYYPDLGITKLDLAHYYEQVAEWILPHVTDRVLAIVRCPEGCAKPCFFQKQPGPGAPEALRRINVAESGAAEYNLAIDDLEGLISLAQMGVLEIHVWGSRTKTLEKPDRLTFDLDPDPSVEWPQVVAAAKEVRLVLEELGLTTFLKTTGGKGLHIVVPIQARTPWDEAKSFCREVAELIVRAAPNRYVATMSKSARKGKIFIDYLRNGRGATAIAAYSTRARPGATVSVPIAWDELGPRVRSDQFTIGNLPARLKKLAKDPWAELATTKQSITAAMLKGLKSLGSE